jgi:phage tail-like protein
MADPPYPFTAFNFAVEITRGTEGAPLVNAAFSDCDGIDMSIEVKTIREGGSNDRQIRLVGPVAYGQITLKRGMTTDFGLWTWVKDTANDPRLRAEADIILLAPDGITERARFQLSRCIPVRIKAPTLNAKDGQIAVEELQLAYETLKLNPSVSA